ncbi:CopD family protein [Ornithinibacillus sp. JPR2-1]|uniref:copper resistance D family protein n=1 Tax=Ornithinibacillus sp. JPR2-1 TaxID=2094019 RepID=UPI0031CE73F3
MEVVVIISKVLLYLCFSVLVGSFILLLVPNKYRPDIKIQKRFLQVSAISLPVISFVPVLDVILYIAPRLGLVESFKIVLTTYTVGTAWIFTFLGSMLLILLIAMAKSTEKSAFAYLGLAITAGVIVTIAWSSHAGAIDPIIGITSDFIHLMAVSIWVGIVLVVGWCSLNYKRWLPFLSWFSVVAIGCLVATALSGLFLMDIMVSKYTDSWMVPYGQGLLMKHLFLIPLIFYALVNGIIVKYAITKNPNFNPIPWVRLEGFILLIIFTITSIYSQQSPPHGNYLSDEAVSPLFRLFHPGVIDASSTIGFAGSINTVYFLFLSVFLLGLMVWAFYKRASIIISLLFSGLFVMSVYFMLMLTVVVR